MTKTITIDGKQVAFESTAGTPRRYRNLSGRDFFADINGLQKAVTSGKDIPWEILESFENIAYVMAKQADPTIPNSPDEWLDGFEMMSVYEILPQLVDLWQRSEDTTAESKKK